MLDFNAQGELGNVWMRAQSIALESRPLGLSSNAQNQIIINHI